MKKLLYSGIAVALLASCAQQLPKDQYLLNGSIQGRDGQYIYMVYAANDTTVVKDSALISNGTFEFKGKMETPYREVSLYMGDPNDYMNPNRCGLYMEPKEMTLNIDTANFGKPVLTGSFTQAQVDSLETLTTQILDEAKSIQEAIAAETDHERPPYTNRWNLTTNAHEKYRPRS